ncbi:UDP-glucoronosyl/UDP-glucosyl transferase family protein [Tripterygium wilfordii]|uniref:Glycosyltransferase n=2 Tax=Tripterygium wilfordii TaxID=458696 RepID=A0A7J7C3R3_TRIWF|nr:UDP-glucoronosyl/UDP-glucosyl transferase family protein [Tripterygium wilfordii]
MEKEQRGASKTHVLLVPFPLQGHINPMIQLSKRLASKRLKITLVSTSSARISMEGREADSPVEVNFISDGYQEGKAETMDEALERIETETSLSLAKLIEDLKTTEYPAKFLIYDSIMPWMMNVALAQGLEGAPFFTQSCAATAIYAHVHQGTLKLPLPLEETQVMLPGMPELRSNDLPSLVYDPCSYPALHKLLLGQLLNLHKASFLLWNTFDGLEDEVVSWMARQWPIKPVGPTIPSIYLDKRLEDDIDYGLNLFKSNSDACLKWLDSKGIGSVVYVSFGSLATVGAEQMEEVAWGLKNSNINFLWVVRESEVKKLPTSFLEEITERGLVVSWSPQLQVLAHKSVGCFVTHCGWNSVLEALSLGVPMVAMPYWVDQPTNAKFVKDVWQVGVRVQVNEKGLVEKEEIARCIKEVMEGERRLEMKRNSERLKEMAREAVDKGGSSDKNIEEFVRKLIHN